MDVRVELDAEAGVVCVTLEDDRAEVVRAFEQLGDTARRQVAGTAWTVGMLAVRQAQGLAAEAQLESVGRELLAGLDQQLAEWNQGVTGQLTTLLATYFDPESGELNKRIDAFVDDDGELAALLKQHVAADNSVLAQTLAGRLGETSPLFRMLDPKHTEGVVVQLEARLKSTLDQSRMSLAEALNPRIEGSPVAQFLTDLRGELREAERTREGRLKAVAAQLDANDENSLLSQLVRRTQEAHLELRKAVNPEQPGSPLAIVRDTITRMAQEAREEQRVLLQSSREAQESFQQQVLTLLTTDRAAKNERGKGPGGGHDFEDLLHAFVAGSVSGAPVLIEATGTRPGQVMGRKVGDLVLRFTSESAFEGAGLVVEAKRDKSFTVTRALAELDLARSNRGCTAGLFVLAASHAPTGFPRFARYGADVVVTWDPDDPGSEAYLHAALQLGLALAARESGTADPGDFEAIADIEERIAHELRRLDTMEKHCDGIGRNVDKLKQAIGVARKKLNVMTGQAQSALRALDAAAESRRRARGHDAVVRLADESLDLAHDEMNGGHAVGAAK